MGAADDIERGQLSCSYKRSFSVRSAGALFRKKDYVIVLDCHSNTIVMHKQRSGEQIKNEVSVDDCLQIEKSNRDETQGNFTFRLDDSDKVKVKSFYFDTYDNRELFCSLVEAMQIAGTQALQLFRILDSSNHGSLSYQAFNKREEIKRRNSQKNIKPNHLHPHSAEVVNAVQPPVLPPASPLSSSSPSLSSSTAERAHGHIEMSQKKRGSHFYGSVFSDKIDFVDFLLSYGQVAKSNRRSFKRISHAARPEVVSAQLRQQADAVMSQYLSNHPDRNELNRFDFLEGEIVFNRQEKVALRISLSNGLMPSSQKPSSKGHGRSPSMNIGSSSSSPSSANSSSLSSGKKTRVSGILSSFTTTSSSNAADLHSSSTEESNHQQQLETQKNPKGVLLITNYRIVFRGFSSQQAVNDLNGFQFELFQASIPLTALIRVTSENEDRSIRLLCKDFRAVVLDFDASSSFVLGVATHLNHMAFPESDTALFAYTRQARVQDKKTAHLEAKESAAAAAAAAAAASLTTSASTTEVDGWSLYNVEQEYKRVGLLDSEHFRAIDVLNTDYSLSPTYPPVFHIPSQLTDLELQQVCAYRSKARVPATVWLHPITGASLSRCAQPLVGLKGHRCEEDEKLMRELRETNPSNKSVLYFVDARPFKAAIGNAVMGKGYENTDHYKKTKLLFMGIDNIHIVRGAMERMLAVCQSNARSQSWLNKLDNSQWFQLVRLVLDGASRMANMMDTEGASVVVHCSDGWDRTSQLSTTAQLLLDPFYRTMHGFAVLIEKGWISFGHKFSERYGHGNRDYSETQRSPVFTQWLDVIYQIMMQHPSAFEFNTALLVAIHDELISCRFGSFLFNSENERNEHNLREKTLSMWSHFYSPAQICKYRNPFYVAPIKPKILSFDGQSASFAPASSLPPPPPPPASAPAPTVSATSTATTAAASGTSISQTTNPLHNQPLSVSSSPLLFSTTARLYSLPRLHRLHVDTSQSAIVFWKEFYMRWRPKTRQEAKKATVETEAMLLRKELDTLMYNLRKAGIDPGRYTHSQPDAVLYPFQNQFHSVSPSSSPLHTNYDHTANKADSSDNDKARDDEGKNNIFSGIDTVSNDADTKSKHHDSNDATPLSSTTHSATTQSLPHPSTPPLAASAQSTLSAHTQTPAHAQIDAQTQTRALPAGAEPAVDAQTQTKIKQVEAVVSPPPSPSAAVSADTKETTLTPPSAAVEPEMVETASEIDAAMTVFAPPLLPPPVPAVATRTTVPAAVDVEREAGAGAEAMTEIGGEVQSPPPLPGTPHSATEESKDKESSAPALPVTKAKAEAAAAAEAAAETETEVETAVVNAANLSEPPTCAVPISLTTIVPPPLPVSVASMSSAPPPLPPTTSTLPSSPPPLPSLSPPPPPLPVVPVPAQSISVPPPLPTPISTPPPLPKIPASSLIPPPLPPPQ